MIRILFINTIPIIFLGAGSGGKCARRLVQGKDQGGSCV
jgi:hypothetical protein